MKKKKMYQSSRCSVSSPRLSSFLVLIVEVLAVVVCLVVGHIVMVTDTFGRVEVVVNAFGCVVSSSWCW